jgi:hypothetical protein
MSAILAFMRPVTLLPRLRKRILYTAQNDIVRGHTLFLIAFLTIWIALVPLYGREKDSTQYGTGLIVNVPFPEADVTQAVKEVIQNGIIRGSKEYERDEYVTGAQTVPSVRGFPDWQEGGQVFYKMRTHALDPRNFKESGDVGTLAVRERKIQFCASTRFSSRISVTPCISRTDPSKGRNTKTFTTIWKRCMH